MNPLARLYDPSGNNRIVMPSLELKLFLRDNREYTLKCFDIKCRNEKMILKAGEKVCPYFSHTKLNSPCLGRSLDALEHALVFILRKTESIRLEYACFNCEETMLNTVYMNDKTVDELHHWVKRVRVPSVSRVIAMREEVEKGQVLVLTSKRAGRCPTCSRPKKPVEREATRQSHEWDPGQFAVSWYDSGPGRCKFIPNRPRQEALCYRPRVGDPPPTASDELPHLLHQEFENAKKRGMFVLSYRYHGPQLGFSYRMKGGLPGYIKN
jgi:hypothetical protein